MNAIQINNLGKMYKLFDKTSDRVADVFGINKLKFWNQTSQFQEFWALRGVNLTIEKGERIGIIGRNGAGKSTLLKLITGTIQPTEGSLHINGNIQALMQLGTGFHPEFTGIENIRTALAYNGVSRTLAKTLEDEIIDFSELEDYINQPVKFYSAGMYSRLAFAVSTALAPDILIIDEVLGAGDAAFTTKCAERMKQLTVKSGATVLFVSHSMESVLEICDRAVLIEKGFVVADGSALEVSKIYNKKIREEEEIRLRAKEYRISKSDIGSIVAGDESNSVLLFHFCTDKPHPKGRHKIYSVRLLDGDKLLTEIRVGAPMDNDRQSLSHLIEGARLMDWDKSRKDSHGFFRLYCDRNGLNAHAPFQLAFPKYLEPKNLVLQVEADSDGQDAVFLEQFAEGAYRRLCRIPQGLHSTKMQLWSETFDETTASLIADYSSVASECVENSVNEVAAELVVAVENAVPNEDLVVPEYTRLEQFEQMNSIYGTQQAVITQVDIFDATNCSKRVFTMGETLKFEISISPQICLDRFTLVVNILTKSGKVATQVFCDSEQLDMYEINKDFVITVAFSPLRLGAEEYMVSVGLFKSCDYSKAVEEESFCVIDRAIFFTVKQAESIKKSMGAFAHSCLWDCQGKQVVFDASTMQNGIYADKEKL